MDRRHVEVLVTFLERRFNATMRHGFCFLSRLRVESSVLVGSMAFPDRNMELYPKSSGAPGAPPTSTEGYIRRRVAEEVRSVTAQHFQALPAWATRVDCSKWGDVSVKVGRVNGKLA